MSTKTPIVLSDCNVPGSAQFRPLQAGETLQDPNGGQMVAQPNNKTGYMLSGANTWRLPDTKPPELVWVSGGVSLTVQARMDQPSIVRHTFQDGKQRTMAAALTWAHANGVADLGYDEAASNPALHTSSTGVTSAAGARELVDAVNFETLGVAAGDEVIISTGPDAGNYTIAAVSGTTITIDEDWAAGGQGVTYTIWNPRWVHLFLVPSASDDDVCSVLASDNAYNAGPTGYTNFKYLGAQRLASTLGTFYQFQQCGRTFDLGAAGRIFYSAASVAAFGWTELDISAYVPATARKLLTNTKVDSAASDGFSYWQSPVSGNVGYHVQSFGGQASDSGPLQPAVITSQTIYHRLVQVQGSGACPYVEARCQGWIDAAVED
jgi:hypothetical protein